MKKHFFQWQVYACFIFLTILCTRVIGADTAILKRLVQDKRSTSYRVSPDGSRIAFLAPSEGAINIWLRGDGGRNNRALTRETESVVDFQWQYDNEHLLYFQDQNGDENGHLMQVDLRGFNTRDLTPFRGIQAHLVGLSPLAPDQVLVSMNLDDRRRHDVYRIDLQSGALRLDTKNPGNVIQWQVDADFNIRAALSMSREGELELLLKDPGSEAWSLERSFPKEQILPELLGFSPDGMTLWYLAAEEGGAVVLWEWMTATGESRKIQGVDKQNVRDVLLDPLQGVPEGIANYGPQRAWHMLHGAYDSILNFLRFDKGDLFFPNRSLQRKHWIVGYQDAQLPTYYQLYTAALNQKVTLLGMERPQLRRQAFRPSSSQEIKGAGDQPISLQFVPALSDPLQPKPLLVRVMDGPADFPGFALDEWAQYFSLQGFSVMTLFHPRVSASPSRDAGLMHPYWAEQWNQDLVLAVQWALKEKQCDPANVFCLATGYGAFAALSAAFQASNPFRGVVCLNGISDLGSFQNELSPFLSSMTQLGFDLNGEKPMGDPYWTARSPLGLCSGLENYSTAILLAHGENNPRIPKMQSMRLHEELQKRGIESEYLELKHTGHQLVQEKVRLQFLSRVSDFMAEQMVPGNP
ncbi:MAG: prolyl oligopeptidase family serine peptidase [Verrucomicrobiota bacterium]|nr:prolyl oligopeptidase family serine peptidase [Verrucomicrobiota bacterium]